MGFAGTVYGATALVGGAILLALALQLRRSRVSERRVAHRLFGFSILYLFVLFAALLSGDGISRTASTAFTRAAFSTVGPLTVGSLQAPCLPCSDHAALALSEVTAGDI